MRLQRYNLAESLKKKSLDIRKTHLGLSIKIPFQLLAILVYSTMNKKIRSGRIIIDTSFEFEKRNFW